MTMQLMSHAYTTTSTRSRKSKPVTINAKFAKEFSDYNKQMKRIGTKTKTLDEYIAYRQGKYKPELKGAVKSPLVTTTWRRESPNIPSFGDQVGSIPAKPEQKYTGTLVTGIATMHKSNAVPVINQKQMEEIARMRRG